MKKKECQFEINTHSPYDPILKKHINYYYFLKKEDSGGSFEFWHYPHFNSTLNFFRNSHDAFDKQKHAPFPREKGEYLGIYSSNTKEARKAVIEGAYNIIGIVFRPLGINHFPSFHTSAQNQTPIIYDSDKSMKPHLESIFSAGSIGDKVSLLEKLLKRHYRSLYLPILEEAISKIIAYRGNITLAELSHELSVSRRTLLRYFKEHLGYSFREFKSVVKFRLAFDEGIREKNTIKQVDLAYNFNFYDQSYFIKHFKTKAKQSPKASMDSVSQLSEHLFWRFF